MSVYENFEWVRDVTSFEMASSALKPIKRHKIKYNNINNQNKNM